MIGGPLSKNIIGALHEPRFGYFLRQPSHSLVLLQRLVGAPEVRGPSNPLINEVSIVTAQPFSLEKRKKRKLARPRPEARPVFPFRLTQSLSSNYTFNLQHP